MASPALKALFTWQFIQFHSPVKYVFSHFANKIQRDVITCLKLQRQSVARLGFNPGSLVPQCTLLTIIRCCHTDV